MAGGGKFFVSVTPSGYENIITKLNQAGKDTGNAIRKARTQLTSILLQAITAQFNNAANREREAFPPIYFIQLLATLQNVALINSTQVSPYSFNVSINFGDLGTEEDLRQAYHYGAQLSSGGTVDLPYHSANLKNDVEVRYQFWYALRNNLTYNGRPLDPGLWNETLSARVAYFNSINKAPQWLLLQYGQADYEPTNQPYPIVETTRKIIRDAGEALMIQNLYEIEVQLVRERFGNDVIPFPRGKNKINQGFGYFVEGFSETNISSKQLKLAKNTLFYIRDAIQARNTATVQKALENLYQIGTVDFQVLAEFFRRGGDIG